jgi:hypothetical protein
MTHYQSTVDGELFPNTILTLTIILDYLDRNLAANQIQSKFITLCKRRAFFV